MRTHTHTHTYRRSYKTWLPKGKGYNDSSWTVVVQPTHPVSLCAHLFMSPRSLRWMGLTDESCMEIWTKACGISTGQESIHCSSYLPTRPMLPLLHHLPPSKEGRLLTLHVANFLVVNLALWSQHAIMATSERCPNKTKDWIPRCSWAVTWKSVPF